MNRKKILLDKDGNVVRKEILINGAGGAMGAAAVGKAVELIDSISKADDISEVIMEGYVASGYITCCCNCGFISEDSAEEVINLICEVMQEEVQKRAEQNG